MKKKNLCWFCKAVMIKNERGDYLCPNKEYDGLYDDIDSIENNKEQ